MNKDEIRVAATGFIPGLIFGAILVWLVLSAQSSDLPQIKKSFEDAPTLRTDDAPIVNGDSKAGATNSSISVKDQPAGRAVLIESVSIPKTTWIAVRDFANGSVGNVLGATRKEAGTSEKVIVDLLRATEPERQYAVVLFEDDGDLAFDMKKDRLISTDSNTPQISVFTAQTPTAPGGR